MEASKNIQSNTHPSGSPYSREESTKPFPPILLLIAPAKTLSWGGRLPTLLPTAKSQPGRGPGVKGAWLALSTLPLPNTYHSMRCV